MSLPGSDKLRSRSRSLSSSAPVNIAKKVAASLESTEENGAKGKLNGNKSSSSSSSSPLHPAMTYGRGLPHSESPEFRMRRNPSSATRILSLSPKGRKIGLLTIGILSLMLLIKAIFDNSGYYYRTGVRIQGLTFRHVQAENEFIVPDLDLIQDLQKDSTTAQELLPVAAQYVSDQSIHTVIVTDLDYERWTEGHLRKVVANRQDYAKKHGYGVFCQWVTDYKYKFQQSLDYKPWARIATVRAAMHSFPNAKRFLFVEQNSIITNYEITVESILDVKSLNAAMLREAPIVKDSQIIKTINSVQAQDTRLVLTQDEFGMSPHVFILDNCDDAKILLDYWTDQQHRTYKLFRTERQVAESLNHILQWHHFFLRKLAMIPTKMLASLTNTNDPTLDHAEGDFIATLRCDAIPQACELEFDHLYRQKRS